MGFNRLHPESTHISSSPDQINLERIVENVDAIFISTTKSYKALHLLSEKIQDNQEDKIHYQSLYTKTEELIQKYLFSAQENITTNNVIEMSYLLFDDLKPIFIEIGVI